MCTDPIDYPLGFTLYATFVLATTLWCTLLIIFRIVTVAQAAGEVGRGLRAYHHTIEILIESSALYSIILIIYLALNAQDNLIMGYLDPLAAFARVCFILYFLYLHLTVII